MPFFLHTFDILYLKDQDCNLACINCLVHSYLMLPFRGRRTPVSWTPPVGGWSEGGAPCGTTPPHGPLGGAGPPGAAHLAAHGPHTPTRPPSWDPFTPSDSRSSPGSDQLSNIDHPAGGNPPQQPPSGPIGPAPNNPHHFYNFDGKLSKTNKHTHRSIWKYEQKHVTANLHTCSIHIVIVTQWILA